MRLKELMVLESGSELDINEILEQLEKYKKNEATGEDRRQVNKLLDEGKKLSVLIDEDKYGRFEKLEDVYTGESAFTCGEELINDIKNDRMWLLSYKRWLMETGTVDLEMLGKSILARAIELCPKDTGKLRRSGILRVYRDYIEIEFTEEYAIFVHEDMSAKHSGGTRAKFLELAVQEFVDGSVFVDFKKGGTVKVRLGYR